MRHHDGIKDVSMIFLPGERSFEGSPDPVCIHMNHAPILLLILRHLEG